jgi:hypothetical protein
VTREKKFPWFRLYAEFAKDPKVQIMPEVMQRRLIMIFCLRCSNELVTLQDDEIAHALRINEQELAETKALFLRKNFINEDWDVLKWDERQFVSDSSAERVARHRAKQKELTNADVTLQSRPANALDTDTDTDKKKKPLAQIPSGFSRFWAAYPKKKSKGDAERAFKTIKPSEQLLETMLQAIERAKTSVDWLKEGGQFIPYPASWLRAKGWEDSDLGGGLTLAPTGEVKPWWKSVAGITAKGKELGLVQTEDVFAHFRDRVYRAAGSGPWLQN